MKAFKKRIVKLLRWSQKYTKTDMVYVAKGGFWLLSGKGFIALISLATTVAFANLLPIETFGTYQFIVAIVGFFTITSLPGMTTALLRASAKNKDASLKLAFKTRLKWSCLGSLGLLFISGWYFLNGNNLLGLAFLILTPIFPFKINYSTVENYWNGKKRFKIKMIIKVIADVAIASSTILALYLSNNVLVIIATFFGSTAFFYTLVYLYSKSKIENNEIDGEMVPFGKNLTLMELIGDLSRNLDKILLWKFLGPAQVAIYVMSFKPIKRANELLPISELALPKLSENGVKGYEDKKSVLRKVLFLFFGLTLPMALILAFFAPMLYKLLFPQYLNSVIYFQALTFLMAVLPATLIGHSLVAEMKTKYLYITKTVAPIIKIILLLLLTPLYGIWGIVASLVLTSVIGIMMNLYFFWKM